MKKIAEFLALHNAILVFMMWVNKYCCNFARKVVFFFAKKDMLPYHVMFAKNNMLLAKLYCSEGLAVIFHFQARLM